MSSLGSCLERSNAMNDYLKYLNESPTVFFKCINDNDWNVEFVTQNVFNLFGYSKEDFISRKITFGKCIHLSDKQQVLDEIEHIVNSNCTEYEFKPYRIISKEGKRLYEIKIIG